MTEHSDGTNLSKKPRNQLAKEIIDLRMKIGQSEASLREVEERLHVQRIQSNQIVLDMRRRLQWQEEVIRSLKAERDRLMRDLTSRLLFVEAELRREQKHIETLLEEKDRIIEQQGRELQILKDAREVSLPVPSDSLKKPWSKIRNAALSRRFSLALDEYIRDCTTVSRASPIFLNDSDVSPSEQADSSVSGPERMKGTSLPRKFPSYHNIKQEIRKENETCVTLPHLDTSVVSGEHGHVAPGINSSNHANVRSNSTGYFPLKKHEAISLPDLRKRSSQNEESDFCSIEVPEKNNVPSRLPSYPNLLLQGNNSVIKIPWYKPPLDQSSLGTHTPMVTIVDSAGLDSESLGSSDQSDSLDSGISVHSISVGDPNDHNFSSNYFRSTSKSFQTNECAEKLSSLNSKSVSVPSSPARKSFNCDTGLSFRSPPEYVFSSPPSGTYDCSSRIPGESGCSGTSTINSDFKTKVVDRSGSCERLPTTSSGVSSWVSGSSNRSFGTNHRSVTKPRDIKFRKLTKFQNRLLGDASSSIGIHGLVNEVVLTV